MNKFELIQTVKDRTELSKQEAIDVVKLFFNSLTEAMINGERIEIRGLCSFFIKKYAGYRITSYNVCYTKLLRRN